MSLWAILEILIPLLLAFLLGWLLRWLWERWRYERVTTTEWNALSTSATKAETELLTVRAAHDEVVNERSALSSRVAALTSESESARTELSAAVRSNESLTVDLDAARAETATLRGELDDANNRSGALEADLATAQSTISGYASLDGEAKQLRADLASSNDRIGELEASLEARSGDMDRLQGELDAAVAANADRDDQINALSADLTGARSELSERDGKIGKLEAGAAAAALAATQLKSSESRVGELEAALNASRNELDGAQTRIADLEGELSGVQGQIDGANARVSELEGELGAAQSEVAGFAQLQTDSDALRGDLDGANARIAELEGELGGALALRGDLDGANARIADLEGQLNDANALRGDLDGANARIAELEAALDEEDEVGAADAERNAAHASAWASGAWIVGQTQLGTAGVAPDHVDDLKKIKGIGPKMEEHLNGFGISSYEQLAALNDDETGRVNDALTSFPGRIYRDEWVPQAQAIMANGHTPLSKDQKADLASANARIGELELELADAAGAGDRVAELEGQLSEANSLRGDLDGANARIGELEGQLADAGNLRGQLDGAHSRIGELEGQLSDANSLRGDLDGANARIGELEGQLVEAEAAGGAAEIGQLRVALTEKDRRIEALENAARTAAAVPDSSTELDAAKATIAARDARIAELEAAQADLPDEARYYAAWKSGAWKSGTTKLGTPGIDHTDDLKVISGIGPQMEDLLNGFGIKSWEQLADFDDNDIATVDAALEDFPGRITRDEWVPQARAIMENGHKPVARAPKPRPKPSWQKGTTKLGTPGAGHKDDLKVINGIGPKMESILNGFGIQAWEQLAALKKAEVETVNDAIESFPGRIERDEWVAQAKELVKEFKDPKNRPTRETYLNRSKDDDPFN